VNDPKPSAKATGNLILQNVIPELCEFLGSLRAFFRGQKFVLSGGQKKIQEMQALPLCEEGKRKTEGWSRPLLGKYGLLS
jgi:hypothetical protein